MRKSVRFKFITIVLIITMTSILISACGKKVSPTPSNTSIVPTDAVTESPSHRSIDEVKKLLQSMPDDADGLNENACFVVSNGIIYSELSILDNFYQCVSSGYSAEIIFVSFTIEGEAILNYLDYDGKDFYLVTDSSRDSYGNQTNVYQEHTYTDFKIFDNSYENGDRIKEVVLSDNTELTYENYIKLVNEENLNTGFFPLVSFYCGNSYADLNNDSYNELITNYDESQVLLTADDITYIVAADALTGESMTLSVNDSTDDFNYLLSCYNALEFEPASDSERYAYNYSIQLLDYNKKVLQTVIPYKDSLKINGKTYSTATNGTAIELLKELEYCFTQL